MSDTEVRWTPEQKARWRSERAATMRIDGAIRRVECPHCHAGIGEDCRTPSWWPTAFHVARKRAAGL